MSKTDFKYNKTESEDDNNPKSKEDLNGECDIDEKLHLVVCVHGLDGNSGDLRLIRTYLELALPGAKLEFLMSEQNQNNTFEDIEIMTTELIKEIYHYIETYGLKLERISFIGKIILLIKKKVLLIIFCRTFVGKYNNSIMCSSQRLFTISQ